MGISLVPVCVVATLGRKNRLFPPLPFLSCGFGTGKFYLSPSCVFLVFCLCLCAVLGTENFTCLPLVVHFSLFFPTSVFVLLPPWFPACFPIGSIAFALPLFFSPMVLWRVTARRLIFPPVWGQP